MRPPKDVIAFPSAERDVEAAIDFYLLEASATIAQQFVEALESAYRFIGEQPAAGSTRYAHEFRLPGLRSWRLRRYPYVIFYMEHVDHIDVWRVLHAASDLPTWMAET
ncbi:type II toxin-antitoxin system RelE/ParE family toxin [Caulobacter segnis]